MPLASVYPLVSSRAVARPFTYEVPDGTERGAVVAVRFGRAAQRGVVVEVGVEAPAGVTVAAVERVVSSVPPALVDLALWLADYYGTTPARALELVAPAERTRRGERRSSAEREGMGGEADAPEPTAEQVPEKQVRYRAERDAKPYPMQAGEGRPRERQRLDPEDPLSSAEHFRPLANELLHHDTEGQRNHRKVWSANP